MCLASYRSCQTQGGIAHPIHKLLSGALLPEESSMQCISEGQIRTSGRLSLHSDQKPCGQSQIINLQPSLARHVSNMHTQTPNPGPWPIRSKGTACLEAAAASMAAPGDRKWVTSALCTPSSRVP